MDLAGPECTGLTEPETLAFTRPCVGFVVADDDYVYWTEQCMGRIVKVPTGGGAPIVVADGQLTPAGLALDEQHLYWTNFGSGASKDGTVVRMPKNGGPVDVLATDQKLPWRLAIHGSRVYWTNFFAAAPLMSVAKDGSEPPEVVAEGGEHARGIAADTTGVYWADYDLGVVLRCPLSGCDQGPVAVADDQPTANAVGLDDTHVFWARNAGRVYRIPKDDSSPATEMHTGFGGIGELLVHDNSILWTESSKIMTMPKSGGTASIVVEIPNPAGLAVHRTCAYYTTFLTGGVYRVRKP